MYLSSMRFWTLGVVQYTLEYWREANRISHQDKREMILEQYQHTMDAQLQ